MHSFLQVDRITQQRHALNLDLIHTDVIELFFHLEQSRTSFFHNLGTKRCLDRAFL
jgi:hypothetical protein